MRFFLGFCVGLLALAPAVSEPVFRFAAGEDTLACDASGQALAGFALTAHGLARLDHASALLVRGGGFEAEEAGAHVAARIQAAEAFTVELLVCAEQADPPEPGAILTLGARDGFPALRIGQAGSACFLNTLNSAGKLEEVLRVPGVEADALTHLAFTYSAGVCTAWVNGKKAGGKTGLSLPIDAWKADRIRLGGWAPGEEADWPGRIEVAALYDTAMDEAAIAASAKRLQSAVVARKAVPVLRVRAKLVAKSPVPSIEELAPYTQSMSVFAYEVVKVIEGEYAPKTLYVAHWCVLDNTPLPFKDTPEGTELELALEPFDENPQLASENFQDLAIEDFALPLYFDAAGASLGFDVKALKP